MSVDERGITTQKIKTSPAMQRKCQGGSVKGEHMERGEATVKNLQGRIF